MRGVFPARGRAPSRRSPRTVAGVLLERTIPIGSGITGGMNAGLLAEALDAAAGA